MANGMYNVAKVNMEEATFNWLDGLWKAVLLDSGYTPNFTTDTTASAWSGHTVGSPVSLAGQSVTLVGQLQANSIVVSGVSSGLTVKGIAVYHDNGSGTTWPAFYFDTGTGLPLTTTGAAITVDWNATVSAGYIATL